ncbi:protein FAM200A-like [Octopus sinensis]|uniref:Protein FAM200A-like n=1 Tax=Octopus sinensis TaxID=2607531 RepID=A0A6P7SQ64_9MOLL|nr:protein FAM200A-like [Octopus sinensis]
MYEKPDNIMKIPLSNNTISRSIDEMANDVKHQLINILHRSEFSIQVDDSTVVDNQCLMMVYVRYFSEDLQSCDEMLFTEKLLLDSNINCSLLGTLAAFSGKNMNSRLNGALQLVIKTVNKLKFNPLSHRFFRELCLRNDEVHTKLLYPTEVRWLSKGNCVLHFVELFHIIVSFFEDTSLSASLGF